MSKVTMPEPDIFDGTRLDGSIASHGYSTAKVEAYAAAKVRESHEWQPIETAPKDGTSIIGYSVELGQRETYMTRFGPGSIGHQLWKDGKGPLESGWMWYEPKNNWAGKWNPTHWRHCPPEPITE